MHAVYLLMALAAAVPVEDSWDWPAAMRTLAQKSSAREGVVLQVGDSITYANPYSQWPRYGKGKTKQDREVLKWSHTGEKNDQDGWHLCSTDQPRGRSYTAASGIRTDQMLKGGFRGLPSLKEILAKYKPQMVVFMLGTNDVSGRKTEDFRRDYQRCVEQILAAGAIPIVSTIPPRRGRMEQVKAYNDAIIAIARDKKVPLIDYYGEILARRPEDWDGSLISKDGVHPSAKSGSAGSASEPTAENLRSVGYLLRSWLSVQKIGEVRAKSLTP